MKKSLYQMLEVEPAAGEAEIAAAYNLTLARLQPALRIGDSDAVNSARMLKDGFAVLSSPERRAKYDETLAIESNAASGTSSVWVDEGKWRRQRSTVTAFMILIVSVAAAVAYFHLTAKMDDTSFEYRQAVAKEQEKKKKKEPAVVDYREIVVPAGMDPRDVVKSRDASQR